MEDSRGHAYSPPERHERYRSSSMSYGGDQYRAAPRSPTASHLHPPPSPSIRDRAGSGYYDPARALPRDQSTTSPAYTSKSPAMSRRVFDPIHESQPAHTSYANGRPGDQRASLPAPTQSSPPVTSRTLPASPREERTSPSAYDPVRNGSISHSTTSAATSAPQRSSNPMAMTNLLSDSAAPEPPSGHNSNAGTVSSSLPPPPRDAPLAHSSPKAHSTAQRASIPAEPRDNIGTPKSVKLSRKKVSVKHEKAKNKADRWDSGRTGSHDQVGAGAGSDRPHGRGSRDNRVLSQTGPPNLTVRDTEAAYAEIEARDLSDVERSDFEGLEGILQEWAHRNLKRTMAIEVAEHNKRKKRRTNLMASYVEAFTAAAEAERSAYIDHHEQEVAEEVRLKEIEEDKERKKDQQRKRRREKAIADEQVKREEALQLLAVVEDEEERARIQKEISRYDKKIRDTQNRLDGILPVKETRHESPPPVGASGRREREIAVDGGLMTSFYSNGDGRGEDTPETTPAAARGGRGGRGTRGGARARKSKEQKQAEKDNAARAQAFLDQGQDLPALAPKEEERLNSLAERRAREESEAASDATPTVAESHPTTTLTGMARFESKGYNQIYEQITRDIAKAVPKVARIKNNSLDTKQSNARKTAQLAAKEARRWQLRTNKSTKDVAARAKRAMREMLGFWKRNERDEREGRKFAEKQELERARRAEAEREANRQKRKLNFLISQTELYSHFIGKKVKTDEIERHGDGDGVTPSGQTLRDQPNAEHTVDLPDTVGDLSAKVTDFDQLDFDAEDETALKQAAMANAQHAIKEAQDRAKEFDRQAAGGNELAGAQNDFDEGEMNFQNPTSLQSMDVTQPKMLSCTLKEYQVKGLNWLVNLYEQGINGILADEMGLGKTVQSISVMAYLAEVHNIWGPFLVIAPASTLHNWQQEITKFVPDIKTLPYWGSAKDRKILRKYWDRKHITYSRDSAFHVLVTSYQLVVQDAAYFQKVKWQYMILDEAQAIKSSQSSRWKSLLGFHCRNRLLLTGTPIQNNMQELWALLHFIMPSLFDSHDEFSEWFSKDIENHAQSNTKLNEDQLRRLHMILKPFMLRRIKKHVQKELGDKIEKDVYCDLTYRQRAYYSNLRNKISILDLIEKAAVGDDQDTATLMNLVMQFRKVCNHPDLFERAEIWSPMSMSYFAETASFMREGTNIDVTYSVRNLIEYWLPNMLAEDQGRLDLAGPKNAKAGWRKRYLSTDLSIWDTRNIHRSAKGSGAFAWLRFVGQSASEVATAARSSLMERVVDLVKDQRDGKDRLQLLRATYDDEDEKENQGFTPVHAMLNIVKRNQKAPSTSFAPDSRLSKLMTISQDRMQDQGYSVLEACYLSRASAPPIELVCHSPHSIIEQQTAFFNVSLRAVLDPISVATEAALLRSDLSLSKYPVTNLLPAPDAQKQRFTEIQVPSMRRFVTDSGKLACLDRLLRELKEGGHRVLLYFQMTRMIDLMEEYLTYRNYKYCRLDGSTKLEDRRDTVAAFQSSPEIFVFLLSTRAGGLGINLTSADTVIFYDSDWNPTIDSQAMDRAHRLGQTRQVTVYRLITRGTIEERIRKRALQKEEVQRVVISGQAGGDRVVDFNQRSHRDGNRTKEMAMWLADDDQAAAIERREAELVEEEARTGGRGRKRKLPTSAKRKEMSMDDMYHEGEGNFADASHEPSGAATPVSAADGPPLKRKKGLSKKAKTVKQRLAVVDGEVG